MRHLAILLAAPLVASLVLSPVLAQTIQQPQQPLQPVPQPQVGTAPTSKSLSASTVSDNQQQPQWVRIAPAGGFPTPPGQTQASSQQQIQAAFPQSNYGADNYAVATSPTQGAQQYPAGIGSQNGIAPMPPLAPPSNYEQAEQIVSPFKNDEIVRLRQRLDDSRKAKAFHPVRTVPRISSISVDLSPGAALPIARVLPGEMSTLVFVDSTGAPWPLAASPRVADPRYFDVEWLQGTPSVVVSALSPYEDGNITVFLRGLATPVVVKLASGEPDSKEKNRVVDYRLDLRVPGRGPNAQTPLLGPGKIVLYDDTMQAFLDGIPPKGAKLVIARGGVPARTQVWEYGGSMFVRTSCDIQTAFDQSMASGDGTRVYRLAPTPYITLSEMGRSMNLQLDLN
jgi:intracellular multiplication protein IcmK